VEATVDCHGVRVIGWSLSFWSGRWRDDTGNGIAAFHSFNSRFLGIGLDVLYPRTYYSIEVSYLMRYFHASLRLIKTSRKWFALGVASCGWPAGVGCSLPSS
jgi:hypothetical protein